MVWPALFSTAEEFLAAVEAYRIKCQEDKTRITLTGLILGIGFRAKQSFYNQRDRGDDFERVVNYARLLVENSYESGGAEGTMAPAISIFALKNFDWSDKTEHELYGKDGAPLGKQIDDEERMLRLEALIISAEKASDEVS